MNRPTAVTAAIAAGLALRVGMACWNGLAGPSFGATADADKFQRFAVAVSEGRWAPGADLTGFTYAYLLGLLYRLTGPSLLLGSLISCGAWLASAVLLVAAMRLLRVSSRSQVIAMVVYAALPSSVIWTSVTLREPYQLLCVNLMLYGSLQILIQRDLHGWLWLFGGVADGALLHEAIMGVGLFIALVLMLHWLWNAEGMRRYRVPAAAVLLVAMVTGGFIGFRTLYPTHTLNGGPAAAIELYLERGLRFPSRTVYRGGVSIGSNAELIVFVPASVFAYLFEPMPWRVNAPIDAGFVTENVVRAVLIGFVLAGLLKERKSARFNVAFVFAAYLCLEMLWSFGTFNWGTAARHHIPATGLLLAAAFAYDGQSDRREIAPATSSE